MTIITEAKMHDPYFGVDSYGLKLRHYVAGYNNDKSWVSACKIPLVNTEFWTPHSYPPLIPICPICASETQKPDVRSVTRNQEFQLTPEMIVLEQTGRYEQNLQAFQKAFQEIKFDAIILDYAFESENLIISMTRDKRACTVTMSLSTLTDAPSAVFGAIANELNIKLQTYERDITYEMIWGLFMDFCQVNVGANDILQSDFLIWQKGTNKFDVYQWFDAQHSTGLATLMSPKIKIKEDE